MIRLAATIHTHTALLSSTFCVAHMAFTSFHLLKITCFHRVACVSLKWMNLNGGGDATAATNGLIFWCPIKEWSTFFRFMVTRCFNTHHKIAMCHHKFACICIRACDLILVESLSLSLSFSLGFCLCVCVCASSVFIILIHSSQNANEIWKWQLI